MSINILLSSLLLFVSLVQSADVNETSDLDDGTIVCLPEYGCLEGNVYEEKGLRAFTAIPYATPPTAENDLRLRNPIKHPGWGNETYDATGIPNACMQRCTKTNVACYKAYANMSEDCLYTNVWTPWPIDNDANLPVMLFIHGGSYLDGWSGSIMYNGENIARLNNVITLSINYRMGAFGYLYSKEHGLDGNYGYYDQLLAIQWAYENIEYFGGDKENIILFGESAGAMSVGTILMQYGASTQDTNVSRWFKGAIMESNPLGLPFRRHETWQDLAVDFIELSGCDDWDDPAECLRSTSTTAHKMLEAQETAKDLGECTLLTCSILEFFAPWTPTFQTDILPQSQPIWGFINGEYNKDVPIMIGTNRNEAVLFVYSFLSDAIDCAEYDIALGLIFDSFGDKLDEITKKYENDAPSSCSDDYRKVTSEMFTDFLFKCPTRYSSIGIASTQSVGNNIYLYNYNYYYTDSHLWYETVDECANGEYICHAAELPEVFQPDSEGFNYTEKDLKISIMMQEYWTNVAKNGEPGESETYGVMWEPFNSDTEYSMVFNESGDNELAQFMDDTEKCKFWDELDYFWMKDTFDSDSDGVCGLIGMMKSGNKWSLIGVMLVVVLCL